MSEDSSHDFKKVLPTFMLQIILTCFKGMFWNVILSKGEFFLILYKTDGIVSLCVRLFAFFIKQIDTLERHPVSPF